MKTYLRFKYVFVLTALLMAWMPSTHVMADDVAIDATNFPDENFRNYLLSQNYGQDGVLTQGEITGIWYINVSNMDIQSLQGIEYFTALTKLYCNYNQLTALDVSNNRALTQLYCDHNQLTALVVSNNPNLNELRCYFNNIDGQAMEALISCLPIVEQGRIYVKNSSPNSGDGNICTLAQAYVANQKGWIVYQCVDWSNWIEMEGEELVNTSDIAIDATNFPDENFRDYLLEHKYGQDGVFTAKEITWITKLSVSEKNIQSLRGIEFFTELTELYVRYNQLTSLDVSNNTALTDLACGLNQLTSLDISKNTALRWLVCDHNQLTSLDVSNNISLRSLKCDNNKLTSLDVSTNNTALNEIECEFNNIDETAMDALVTSLPTIEQGRFYVMGPPNSRGEGNVCTPAQVAVANTKGWKVYQYDEGWEWVEMEGEKPDPSNIAIDATNFPDENFRNYLLSQGYGQDGVLTQEEIERVTEIDVIEKNIQSLKGIEFFTALTWLRCESNQLTSLDVSKNTALTYFNCGVNELASLDVSKNTALTHLLCGHNQLTSLDVSNNTALTHLECHKNQIDEAAMDALIASLPSVELGGFYAKADYDWRENNVITPAQVAIANAKGWTVYQYDINSYTWVEMEADEMAVPDEAIDLGLPSGTKWAPWNVGASKPEDYGGYYAWGETEEKDVYNWDTYQYGYYIWDDGDYSHLVNIGTDIAGTDYDVAHVKWGASWKMPTIDQVGELLYNCTHEWTTVSGINGCKFTGPNGNSIFLPAADVGGGDMGSRGHYWSSTLNDSPNYAHVLYFYSSDAHARSSYSRESGLSVRPVINREPSATDIAIDATNFPDENFRNWILAQDYGQDGVLTEEEIAGITSMNVSGYAIKDLTGIGVFTALQELSCSYNQLTSLDVSKNTALQILYCYSNQLTTLDVSKNTALTYLDCEPNQLTSLDVSKNTALQVLYCGYNQLMSLDVSNNTALTELYCGRNQLTSLDVSKNATLEGLDCYENQLTALDISKNTALKSLSCYGNQQTALDVSNNTALRALDCGNNQLTTLDVSKNAALGFLYCYTNQLTALDVSNNTVLRGLYCENNQLTTLDVSKNTALQYLYCNNNQLTALDVSNNTALTLLYCYVNKIKTLDLAHNTSLQCIYAEDNQLTSLIVSPEMPLKEIGCYNNLIKDEAMDALIASLPTVENGKIYALVPDDEREGNVCTPEQATIAWQKGWDALKWDGSQEAWVNIVEIEMSWVKVATGTYHYYNVFYDEPEPGYEMYASDNRPGYYKIANWFYGDNDFVFTWNQTTNACSVADQYTGYDHSYYGPVRIVEGAKYSSRYAGHTSYYDPETKTFHFFPAYYVDAGSFGQCEELFEITDADTDISQIDNVIYVEQTEALVGSETTLSIKMKNTAQIRGFQFDMYLPEGVTVAQDNKGRLAASLNTGRLEDGDDHTLTVGRMADGSYRFLCGSIYEETFTGNDGEIISLTLDVADDMEEGDYPLVLKNVKLTENDISKKYLTAEVRSTLTIIDYTLGDINGDGAVDVSDYIGIANYILGNTPVGFNERAADVNQDGSIDVSDYIGVANIILTGSIYGTQHQSRISRHGYME